jgi:hypothetical protein
MLRFIAESNTGAQGSGIDDITRFLRALIFQPFGDITSVTEIVWI